MEELPYLDEGHPPGTGRRYYGVKNICSALSTRCYVSIVGRNGHSIGGIFAPVRRKDLPLYGFPTSVTKHNKAIIQRYDGIEEEKLIYCWRIIPWEDIGRLIQDKQLAIPDDQPFPLPPPRRSI